MAARADARVTAAPFPGWSVRETAETSKYVRTSFDTPHGKVTVYDHGRYVEWDFIEPRAAAAEALRVVLGGVMTGPCAGYQHRVRVTR